MSYKVLQKLITLCPILILGFNVNLQAQTSNNAELVILNWSEYIDPDIIKKFELKYKTRIRQIYFESDDSRDEMLLENNGSGYDLVVSSGRAIRTYRKRGWLEPINKAQVPNLRHINKKWLDAFESSAGYSVPYFWGTLGIAYRKDLVNTEITSWKQLLEPDDSLHQKILMANSVDDVLSVALKSLGFSSNSHNKDEYKLAEELLLRQKKHVNDYTYLALNEDSALVKGNIHVSMAYSGDALMLMEIEPEIKYVVPVEGGGLWVDYFTVMKKSTNKKLAFKFIDFINEPENAAKIAEYVYYATPNTAAEKLLPEDFLTDTTIYPDKKTLEISEFNRPLPAKIKRYKNNIFNNLTN